ncbi:MAG: sigma-70 family RNA polymerase sigma factor [Planctomycetales bacterium]|nr:sigma-70 family RNA polymerase sigma factor [Planctomycetales bacterium]
MSTVFIKPKKNTDASFPSADWTDEQLIVRYQETGDQTIFAELVRRYERELYVYLRRYLGDAELAEDVFQATFLQLHLKCKQFDPSRRLRPWLYMIATNKAIDLQRRQKRYSAVSLQSSGSREKDDTGRLIDMLISDEPGPMTRMDRAEEDQWVSRNKGELPDHLRLVVDLVYYQGMKYREAAEVLSIPVGTVKSRLHAAITKLTEAWDDPQNNRG